MIVKKKVIQLAYYFPPVKAIGSIRNKNVADSFYQLGYDVQVFTSDPLAKNNAYKVEGVCPYDIKHMLPERSVSTKVSSSEGKRWTTKIMSSFPLNLLLGEGGIIYTIRILKKLWKHRNEEVIIYSSFRPIADHHIAFLFTLLNRKAFWIADYRDILFDKDELDVFLPNLQEKLYRSITRRANILTTVSNGLSGFFANYNDNIFVLRNGVENTNEVPSAGCLIDKNKFCISYTGALYKGRRDPSILFSTLKEIIEFDPQLKSNISLHYAGKEGALWNDLVSKYGLDEINNCHNLISRDQSLRLQKDSSVNLLLTWCSPNNQGILTGKFFEYLKARKPIVTIIKGDRDAEFEEIFNKDEIGILVYDSQSDVLKTYLLELLGNWKADNYKKYLIKEEVVNSYKWDNAFIEFNEYLKKKGV